MCGILGLVNLREAYKFKEIEKFEEALNLQSHRGPDDSDIYYDKNIIFGHRRLSILDLTKHARQPMFSKCERYILVFNGEIYNYIEIRDELVNKGYIFDTNSDTEVLLYAYIEYGIKCIDYFIGMFSFSVYDKKNKLVYIVRDRLGIKPLYYFKNNEKLIFSSEIKSIIEILDKDMSLNEDAISSYLSFRYPILNDTFFKDIFSVPPGHYIKITEKNIETIEYWDCHEKIKEQKEDRGEDYYIRTLKVLLKSAVNYRMRSDVPFGAFLSGGVDSSVITTLMSENSEKPIKTFTIGFKEEGYNEFKYANIIAKRFKTEHQELLLSGENYLETMEELIGYKDAPLSVPNEIPLYLLAKQLKKYITVVLSGEGADEIFGGYGRIFRSPYDLERMKNIDNLDINEEEKKELCKKFIKKYGVNIFNSHIEHFLNIYSYTSYEEKTEFFSSSINLEEIEKKFYNKFLAYFEKIDDESYYNKLMYTFEKIHLLGLLQRVDCTTMAASVEARVPFVDHRVVEFAFTIPIKYKLKWQEQLCLNDTKKMLSDEISENYDIPKYILKKAYEGMIPDEVLYRKKIGFPVPLNNWFGGEFNNYAREILLTESAKNRNLYNIKNIEKYLNSNELIDNHSLAMKIWMLVNLEIFIKKYIKG